MKQRGLSRIEELAEEMVEGAFGRLFGGRLEALDVVNHLARAIEDNGWSGQMPMSYQVVLNPDDLRFLLADNPDLADSLAAAALQLGQRAGINGVGRPLVSLIADPQLKKRRIRITAQEGPRSQADGDKTQAYKVADHEQSSLRTLEQLDAFLIIQGRRHIPLDRPVITLGRRTDNDVVLDLPSVSRQHAQIRWRFGNFILYDISSRSSSLVNGHSISEQILRPGDVIALGDALLVYGEGNQGLYDSRSEGDADTLARSSG